MFPLTKKKKHICLLLSLDAGSQALHPFSARQGPARRQRGGSRGPATTEPLLLLQLPKPPQTWHQLPASSTQNHAGRGLAEAAPHFWSTLGAVSPAAAVLQCRWLGSAPNPSLPAPSTASEHLHDTQLHGHTDVLPTAQLTRTASCSQGL